MENTNFTNDYVEIDSEKGTITIKLPENPFEFPLILTSLLAVDIETKTELFGKGISNSVVYACIDVLLNHTDTDYELIRKQ